MAPGAKDSITDVAGITVGHWTDLDAATGCTVVLCTAGATGGVDVRGGAPGTLGTESLVPGRIVSAVNAVLLTGGSAYGLGAAMGVLRWCEEHGFGLSFGRQTVPIVTGAVVFDLNIGRGDVRPDAGSGYAACEAATTDTVAEGSVGAGTGATVAKALGPSGLLKGGIGSASEDLGGGLIVGALVAVNAVGEVYDSAAGRVIAGPRGSDGRFVETLEVMRGLPDATPPPGGNTTIGVLATNARLDKGQAWRLATVAHDGIARAVRPAHTLADGDTIFSLATGEREVDMRELRALEAFSAVAVERAIVRAVRAATSLAGITAIRDLEERS